MRNAADDGYLLVIFAVSEHSRIFVIIEIIISHSSLFCNRKTQRKRNRQDVLTVPDLSKEFVALQSSCNLGSQVATLPFSMPSPLTK